MSVFFIRLSDGVELRMELTAREYRPLGIDSGVDERIPTMEEVIEGVLLMKKTDFPVGVTSQFSELDGGERKGASPRFPTGLETPEGAGLTITPDHPSAAHSENTGLDGKKGEACVLRSRQTGKVEAMREEARKDGLSLIEEGPGYEMWAGKPNGEEGGADGE